MATKIHHNIDPIHISNLRDLIDLIRNADKYSELLDALEARYSEASRMVELVGPANQISSLLATARTQKSAADRILSEANDKAARVIAEAEEKAGLLLAKAKDTSNTIHEEATDLMNRMSEDVKNFEGKKQALDIREKQLVERESSLSRLQADTEALRKSLKEKMDQIKRIGTS